MEATLWRLQGVQTIGGGDLELGELRLWGESAALDVGALFRASHAPISGTLENLRDGLAETTCRWAASDVASPGFYIEWETASAVDAWCVRLSAPQPELAIGFYTLATPQNGVWQVADNGWLPYTGGLSPARVRRPVYGVSTGWTQPAGPTPGTDGYRAAAVSADGQTVVLCGAGSSAAKVNLSKDGGSTWTQPTGPVAGTAGFHRAAVSADGQVIVVTGYGSSAAKVSLSIDGGVTWSQPSAPVVGASGFTGAAISDDGQTIVVTGFGSSAAKVNLSTDGGATWSQPTVPVVSTYGFIGAGMSADGQTIAVAEYGAATAKISISKNGGSTWSQASGPLAGSTGFQDAAVSADGQVIVVTGYGSSAAKVSLSTNGGTTWSQPSAPVAGTLGFVGAAVSPDGQTIAVVGYGSAAAKVNLSADGGATWSQPIGPIGGTNGFHGVGVSEDGQITIVAGAGGSSAVGSLNVLPDPMYVGKPMRMQTPGVQAALVGVPPFAQGYVDLVHLHPLGFDTEFGGDGVIYGTVAIKADPTNTMVARRVRLRRSRDGLHVRETWSDAQGVYRVEGINRQYEYDVEAWDHTGNMRSVLANNVTPEKMV